MELIIEENIRKIIDKSYLKRPIIENDINKFKNNLSLFLENIEVSNREETQKGDLTKFLNETYYSGNHYINAIKDIDLAIHESKSQSSSISVIIEAKKTSNSAEMITKENINGKAFYELILYYLRERISENNTNLKYLIITNMHEWFVFDALEFNRVIASDKELVKKFIKFENRAASGNTTEYFYSSIAAPFVKDTDKSIKCAYVNLKKKQKLLTDNRCIRQLEDLYKFFSPIFLLKQYETEDNNHLNKNFYLELLHIMGLSEVEDNGKRIIKRKEKSKRDGGSLIESAITQIDSHSKLDKIKGIKNYGESDDDKLFNISLELTITWINRILFLKLLEAQLLSYNNNSPEYKFLSTNKIKSYDDLDSLFFQVLAIDVASRKEHIRKRYPHVPYLNSSLFETTELEQDAVSINMLNDNENIILYSKSILKKYKRNIEETIPPLTYLLQFLDAYDFGADTGGIQREQKTIISASVLGLIFEKINGYKDGSIFTPSYITMFMCRETITKTVLQKFNEIKGWKCNSLTDLHNLIENKTEANEIINQIRICDPAVGSGHFLVSALNELIYIKKELNILVDDKGKTLKDYEISVYNDELVIEGEDGFFSYTPSNPESQRVQETLFREKQTIIENCLFGVDINPNSVKICQLRLWIELLKSTFYKRDRSGLETLPNIDINIKCGNSLIKKYELNQDIESILEENKLSISEYKSAVDSYKNAKSKEQKKQMRDVISRIKGNIETEIKKQDPDRIALSKTKDDLRRLVWNSENLFENSQDKKVEKKKENLKSKIEKLEIVIKEKEENQIFTNALEWRIEFPEILDEKWNFIGFDLIIGNPPYIYFRNIEDKERDYYQNKFRTSADLYVYFTYIGNSLLKKQGYISYITPNTYFTLSTRTDYRKFLLANAELKFIYSGYCFEDAYVETTIFSFKKEEADDVVTFVMYPQKIDTTELYSNSKENYNNNIDCRLFYPTAINIDLFNRIQTKISNIANTYSSLLYAHNKKEKIKEYATSLRDGDYTLLGLISDGEQGLVTGNNSKYLGYIPSSDIEIETKNKIFLEKINLQLSQRLTLDEFYSDKKEVYERAESLKKDMNKPTLFGKTLIYKSLDKENIKSFSELSLHEQQEGGDTDLWVYYNRGNSEGLKWYVPMSECINWSKLYVKELKESTVTNSRWQGDKYFNVTGFGWVDYFTNELKAFFVEDAPYSKNIVKFHTYCELLTDKYIVALLNSKFISYYIKNFITLTHTLQINDGRLIPIVVPSQEILNIIENLVEQILELKKNDIYSTTSLQEKKLNDLVYKLYGLNQEEIAFIESSFN